MSDFKENEAVLPILTGSWWTSAVPVLCQEQPALFHKPSLNVPRLGALFKAPLGNGNLGSSLPDLRPFPGNPNVRAHPAEVWVKTEKL